jgi:hypothetical protein
MAPKRLASLSMIRDPLRIVACLIFLLLLSPISELLHADNCEWEAYHVCHVSSDNNGACTKLIVAILQPATTVTYNSNPVSLPTDPFTTVRSRGPPLT